jgi:hypothetical protein
MWEATWNLILSNVLEIVLTIISIVVARYVIPYIKTDLIPWLKEKRLLSIIKGFVRAAEKMAESGLIKKANKKDFVIGLLKKNGVTVDDTVDAFIESCVKELDMVGSIIFEEIEEITEMEPKAN